MNQSGFLSDLRKRLGSKLQGLSYLHRGVVLTIDIICSLMAGAVAYIATCQCLHEEIHDKGIVLCFLCSGVLGCFIFLIFRFYRVIIRHASLRSLPRIMGAVITISLLQYIVANVVRHDITHAALYAAFYCVFACCFIIGVRVAMISAYYFVTQVGDFQGKRKAKKVFLCGPIEVCVNHARLLEAAMPGLYNPIAIVDLETKAVKLQAGELKLYTEHDLEQLHTDILNHVPDVVIFVSRSILHQEDERLVAWCNDADMQIFITQAPEHYDENAPLQLKQVRIEDLLQRDEIVVEEDNINAMVSGRTVMVTGAAGSIGSELVRQLCKYHPAAIVLLDNGETPLHLIRLEIEEAHPDITIHPVMADVRDKERCARVFAKYHPSIVYHAAAYKHVPLVEEYPCEGVITNVNGSVNMADLSVEYGVEKFVMISTDKAVNPTNVMGTTKRVSCMYVQALNEVQNTTKFITTRFGNVLGSNGSVIPRFTKQIETGGPITVTHPDIVRFFMTIPEACRLVLQAATMGQGGEIFVFDMGKPVRIADMARRMVRLSGLEPDKDIKIIYTGLRPGEKLYEEVLAHAEETTETKHHKIRITQARKVAYDEIKAQISDLLVLAREGKVMDTVRQLKLIVPEYKSKNSPFEVLDNAH